MSFCPKLRRMQWLNLRRPSNKLIFWTRITQQVLSTSERMLWKTFQKLTLALLSLTLLLLPALFFKLAPRMSMWKMMPVLSHPRTTPMPMPPLLKDETFTQTIFVFVFLLFGFCLFLCFGTFLCNQSTLALSMILGRGF